MTGDILPDRTPGNIEPVPESILGFVATGFMPEQAAIDLAEREQAERLALAEKLGTMDRSNLTEGEASRLTWASNQLAKEAVNVTVFTHVVATRAVVGQSLESIFAKRPPQFLNN